MRKWQSWAKATIYIDEAFSGKSTQEFCGQIGECGKGYLKVTHTRQIQVSESLFTWIKVKIYKKIAKRSRIPVK